MYRFFGIRYSRMVLSFRVGRNLHDYSQKANMTISHISNVMDHWAKLGLIKRNKKGREMEVVLTEKGKVWAKMIQDFDNFSKNIKMKPIILNVEDPKKVAEFKKEFEKANKSQEVKKDEKGTSNSK